MIKDLRGVIPALTTTFKADSDLDLTGFRELADVVIRDGVNGICVNGCTGESWALNETERQQVFEAAAETAAGRVPVVAGCGAMRAKDAIAKVRQAERAGCDVAMVQPPWYILPSLEEVQDYYIEILEDSRLPVMLYNIPRRTGVNFTVEFADALAAHPNVIAIKESSKDWLLLSAIIRCVRDRINVFAGYAGVLGLAAISEGAVGYVDSTTPVVGTMSPEFYAACIKGDLSTARDLQARLASINFFGIGTFPASVKAALELVGRPGGRPRDPLRALNAAQREAIRQVLVEAGVPQALERDMEVAH